MLFKHSLIYSAVLLFNGLLGFVAVSLYTHILSAEAYGYYSLCYSAAIFIALVSFEWQRISLMRFSQSEAGAQILSASLALYLLFVCIILISTGAAYGLNVNLWFPAHGWIGVGMFSASYAVSEMFLSLARATLKPALFASMQMVRGCLSLLFGALAAIYTQQFYGLLAGMSLANLCVIGYGLWRNSEWRTLRPALPSKDSLSILMTFGLPIIFNTATMLFLSVADRYVISHFHGAAIVGAYAAASDLTQRVLQMLASGINLAAYNLNIQAYERDGLSAAEQRIKLSLVVLITILFPVAAGISLVSAPIAKLLLGEAVQATAIDLMPYLSAAAVMQILRSFYLEQPYHLLKTTKLLLVPFMVAAGVALAAWVVLVPDYAGKGIVYGLLLAHLIGGFLTLHGLRGKFQMHLPVREIMIVAGATLIMSVVVGLDWPENSLMLIGRIFAGGVAYATILFAVNHLSVRTMLMNKLRLYIS